MAATVEQYRAKLEKALYEKNAFTDVLQTIEEKTGVKRIYLVGGVIAVVALWLVFGYGGAFLSTFLGFVYPAYMSVKAIESERKDDDTQWLTYWVVFGVFSLGEFFTDIFLSWFPFYYLFKMIFLGWCMAPIESNGANFLYHRFIKPFVLKHEKEIDDSLGKVTDIASSTLNEGEDGSLLCESDGSTKNGDSDASSSSDYNGSLLEVEEKPLGDSLLSREGSVTVGLSHSYSPKCLLDDGASSDIKEEPPPLEGGGSDVTSVRTPSGVVNEVGTPDAKHLSGRMPEVQECQSVVVETVDASPPQCAQQSQGDTGRRACDASVDTRDDICVDDGYTSSDEGGQTQPDSNVEVAPSSGEPDVGESLATLGEPSDTLSLRESENCSDEARKESTCPHMVESKGSSGKGLITEGRKDESEKGLVDDDVESNQIHRDCDAKNGETERTGEEKADPIESKACEVGLSHDEIREESNRENDGERRDGEQSLYDDCRTDGGWTGECCSESEVKGKDAVEGEGEECRPELTKTDTLKLDVADIQQETKIDVKKKSMKPPNQRESSDSSEMFEKEEKFIGTPENVVSPVLEEEDIGGEEIVSERASSICLEGNTLVSERVATEHSENVEHESCRLVTEVKEDVMIVGGEESGILPVPLGEVNSEDVERNRDVSEPPGIDESVGSYVQDLTQRSANGKSDRESSDECIKTLDSDSVEHITVQPVQARLDEVTSSADQISKESVEISNGQVESAEDEVCKTGADTLNSSGGESSNVVGVHIHGSGSVDEVWSEDGDVAHGSDEGSIQDVGEGEVVDEIRTISESGYVGEDWNINGAMMSDVRDLDTGRDVGGSQGDDADVNDSGDTTKHRNVDEIENVSQASSLGDVGVVEAGKVDSGNVDESQKACDNQDFPKSESVDGSECVTKLRSLEVKKEDTVSDEDEKIDSFGVNEGKDDTEDVTETGTVDKGKNVKDSGSIEDVKDNDVHRDEDHSQNGDEDEDKHGDVTVTGNVQEGGIFKEDTGLDDVTDIDAHRSRFDGKEFVMDGDVSESGDATGSGHVDEDESVVEARIHGSDSIMGASSNADDSGYVDQVEEVDNSQHITDGGEGGDGLIVKDTNDGGAANVDAGRDVCASCSDIEDGDVSKIDSETGNVDRGLIVKEDCSVADVRDKDIYRDGVDSCWDNGAGASSLNDVGGMKAESFGNEVVYNSPDDSECRNVDEGNNVKEDAKADDAFSDVGDSRFGSEDKVDDEDVSGSLDVDEDGNVKEGAKCGDSGNVVKGVGDNEASNEDIDPSWDVIERVNVDEDGNVMEEKSSEDVGSARNRGIGQDADEDKFSVDSGSGIVDDDETVRESMPLDVRDAIKSVCVEDSNTVDRSDYEDNEVGRLDKEKNDSEVVGGEGYLTSQVLSGIDGKREETEVFDFVEGKQIVTPERDQVVNLGISGDGEREETAEICPSDIDHLSEIRYLEIQEGSKESGSLREDKVQTSNNEQDIVSDKKNTTEINEENRLGSVNGDGRQNSPIPFDPDTVNIEPKGVNSLEKTAAVNVMMASQGSSEKKVQCHKVTTVTDTILTICHKERLEGQVLKSLTTSEKVVTTETIQQSISLQPELIDEPN